MKYFALSLMTATALVTGAAMADTPLYGIVKEDAKPVVVAQAAVSGEAEGDLYAVVEEGEALESKVTIDTLPDEGPVELQGTVIEIDDEDEFTLSDGTGEIEVELMHDTALTVGDRVIVTGDVDSLLGFGKDIDDATVTVMPLAGVGM